jgi:hypothetical protein
VVIIGTAKIGMSLISVKVKPTTQKEVKKKVDNGTFNNEAFQTS